jgi:hypothetical protein
MDLSKHMLFQSVRLVGAVGTNPAPLLSRCNLLILLAHYSHYPSHPSYPGDIRGTRRPFPDLQGLRIRAGRTAFPLTRRRRRRTMPRRSEGRFVEKAVLLGSAFLGSTRFSAPHLLRSLPLSHLAGAALRLGKISLDPLGCDSLQQGRGARPDRKSGRQQKMGQRHRANFDGFRFPRDVVVCRRISRGRSAPAGELGRRDARANYRGRTYEARGEMEDGLAIAESPPRGTASSQQCEFGVAKSGRAMLL